MPRNKHSIFVLILMSVALAGCQAGVPEVKDLSSIKKLLPNSTKANTALAAGTVQSGNYKVKLTLAVNLGGPQDSGNKRVQVTTAGAANDR